MPIPRIRWVNADRRRLLAADCTPQFGHQIGRQRAVRSPQADCQSRKIKRTAMAAAAENTVAHLAIGNNAVPSVDQIAERGGCSEIAGPAALIRRSIIRRSRSISSSSTSRARKCT
jgi:hypothetical protein